MRMNEVRGLGPVAAAGIVVTLVPTLAVDLGPRIWWPSRPAREGFPDAALDAASTTDLGRLYSPSGTR
jgi:hypothetical protein